MQLGARRSVMLRKALLIGATVLVAACSGSPGNSVPVGPTGPAGDGGSSACAGLPAGQSPGMTGTVSVSGPANGSFVAAGEQPVLTIAFANQCGTHLTPSQLTSAELFVYGPRAPTQTVTNMDLLNVPYAVFGAYSNLQGYSDGGPPNLSLGADGTVTYTLSPITLVDGGPGFIGPGEIPGTYSASVLGIGANPLDQTFVLADFQIGTATVEALVPGPADSSTCLACHQNEAAGGKVYLAHIAP